MTAIRANLLLGLLCHRIGLYMRMFCVNLTSNPKE